MRNNPLSSRSKALATLLPAIRNAIRSQHLDGAAAADACQEVLIALAPRAARIDAMTDSERAAYVWVTARRIAARMRRSLAATTDVASALRKPAPAAERPDRVLAAEEQLRRVSQAIYALPTGEREAVETVASDDVTQEEAAAALGIPRSTLASRLRRARRALRDIF